MKRIQTLDELKIRMSNRVRDSCKKTIIIGGHYALEKDFKPGFLENDTFGIFPQATFDLACGLIRTAKDSGRESKLALLVDDHSLMSMPNWYLFSQRRNDEAEMIRKKVGEYFENFQVPEKYLQILAGYGLCEKDILPASDSCLAFQESIYRQKFELENPGATVGCAGEYQLILKDLAGKGIQRVFGFIPVRCQRPTYKAAVNYNLRRNGNALKVIHAYLPTDSELNSIDDLNEEIARNGGITVVE